MWENRNKKRAESFLHIIQDAVWAIHPAKLEEIETFIVKRLNGEQTVYMVDFQEEHQPNSSYEIKNGTAIIPIEGSLTKRANLLTNFSGGTSTQIIQSQISKALTDESVEAILLSINSPGGTIDGTKELSDYIYYNVRGKKPIVAYADGMMCSAAYWIGSAADKVIAFDTSMVGSIGVALTHFDRSQADEKMGIKRTMIYAGKYKRLASDEKPLTKEGREELQEKVDTFYSIFVNDVARNLGVDTKTVLSNMADGRVFIGEQAVAAGLVHKIGNFDLAMAELTTLKGGIGMNFDEYKAKFPQEAETALAKAIADAQQKWEVETDAKIKAAVAQALEKTSGSNDAPVKELMETVQTLKANFEAAERENKELRKTVAIMTEKVKIESAENIATTVLRASTLSQGMGAKVCSLFKDSKGNWELSSYTKEDGSFDAEKFKAKFSEEVKSFETLISNPTVAPRLPIGETLFVEGSDGASVDADVEYGRSLVVSQFGKQDR